MRESKTLYFCRFSDLFFCRQVKHTVEIWKTTCIKFKKIEWSCSIRHLDAEKKNSQTKSFQTNHFTSHTKAKVFTFPKYSSKYFAFLVSKKHFSFVYVAPTLLQRWWLHARKNLLQWIFFHFCILMKCNAIDMLCTISLGRNRMW